MSARKDGRPYIKLSLDFMDHPKLADLTPSTRCDLIALWIHCARYKTDGVVEDGVMRRTTTTKRLRALVDAGLVECIEADDSRENFGVTSSKKIWRMHDYLLHQTSRAEQEKKAETSRSNGKLSVRNRMTEASAGGLGEAHVGAQPGPEAEVEVETELSTYVGSAARGNVPSVLPPQHALDLVQRLASPGVPGDALASLAAAADRLLREPGVNRLDVDAAVAEWFRRPDAGPGLLPHLVGDAAKARRQPAPPMASKAVVLTEMAREARR